MSRPIDEPLKQTGQEDFQIFPQSLEKEVDILFVVDNSPSMQEEQTNLRAQFPKLIDTLRMEKLGPDGSGKPCTALDTSGCRIPNVHIGVVSTDLGAGNYTQIQTCEQPGGDGGRLLHSGRAGCKTPTDPWIRYDDSANPTNIAGCTGDPIDCVKESFQCIADLGVTGCGLEMPLEVARLAVDPAPAGKAGPINPGFLRPNAFLAIIFMGDEDDCSARRTELFDPNAGGGQTMTSQLGPMNYRCFEFGIQCEGIPPNNPAAARKVGPRKNCEPGYDWLYRISDSDAAKKGYVEFFKSLKALPNRVIMFAIGGPVDSTDLGGADADASNSTDLVKVRLDDGSMSDMTPTCVSDQTEGAAPAIRIRKLVKAFGERGHFNSGIDSNGQPMAVDICRPLVGGRDDSGFAPTLRKLGKVIVANLGGQCLSSPVLLNDGSLACQAGVGLGGGQTCTESCLADVECQVREVTVTAKGETETYVERCPAALFDPAKTSCGASCPCWRIVQRPACNPTQDGSPFGFEILRTGKADTGTVAKVSCGTSIYGWGTPEMLALPRCGKK